MEIDPRLQLLMLLGAFLSGVALCGFFQLLQAVKILIGAYVPPAFMEARYARPLPLLHRGVPFCQKGAARRLWRGLTAGVLDCLFCVIFAAVQVLLLYAYNDGAFRLSVPVLALGGFALLQLLSARVLLVPMAYFAYGFAALMLYLGALLALPAKGVRRFLWRPAVSCYRRIMRFFAIRRSAMLCVLQLQWAERGLEGECPHRPRKKERKGCDMSKKRAEGRTTPTQWVIRILILVIFVVALIIGANRLMEWNQLRGREEELQEEKDALTEGGQSAEN